MFIRRVSSYKCLWLQDRCAEESVGGVKSCACWLNYLKRIVDPQVAGSVSELVGSVYCVV